MKDIHFSKAKFNISWISIIVIFIGAVIYVPVLYFSSKETKVVYYKIPMPSSIVPVTTPASNAAVKNITIEKAKLLITKDLQLGDIDPEVKILQEYLNNKGFLVAESGPGSPGQETVRFGAGTQDALIRFQEANSEVLLKPLGLSVGTGIVGDLTRKLINS